MAFNLPHVRKLGTNHCGKEYHKSFYRIWYYQDITCCHEYEERLVESFVNQIQSEYYGGNR